MKDINFHINNLLKHDIEWFEAEEAFLDGWSRRRKMGDNYEILGRTGDGRYLQILYEDQANELWVFHARDMNATEKRRYHRK